MDLFVTVILQTREIANIVADLLAAACILIFLL